MDERTEKARLTLEWLGLILELVRSLKLFKKKEKKNEENKKRAGKRQTTLQHLRADGGQNEKNKCESSVATRGN